MAVPTLRHLGSALRPILLTLLVALPASLAGAQVPSRGAVFPDFAELVERVAPAVVNIRASERAAEGARLPLRRPEPGQPSEEDTPRGEGSGFITSADGYVLTNAHVIEGAGEVIVTLDDRREFKARVVGADERSDVALLKIEAGGLPAVRLGDVGRLRVGEWVLAIGSPFGLDSTVTAGIVSAKQRETGSDIALLQTDVAVNPGNSGGPLINTRGEVVGVNSQILSPVGSYIGISFAIPIDEAMHIADQLRRHGRVVRGYLGIQPADVPRELAEGYGLMAGKGRTRGAFVRQVIAGAPGEQAGILPADVIVSVDGRAVEGAVDLRRTLGGKPPGSTVVVDLNRRGKLIGVKAVLGDLGQSVAAAERVAPPPAGPASAPARAAERPWGLAVGEISPAQRRALGGNGGVAITAVSDGAESVGLRVGDVILAVGSLEVTDPAQFDAVLAALDKDRALPITLRRGAVAMFLRVPAGR